VPPDPKKTYYDRKNSRLITTNVAATPSYWDNQWRSNRLKEVIEQESQSRFTESVTRKFIKAGEEAKILDGGCGRCGVVLSLSRAGYDAYGIDYAKETITKVKELYPELKIQNGSVTNLPYVSNYFDGYWSLGVIEHDYTGFSSVIAEAYRVLKPGGYLFITYPVFSPLRRVKAFLGLYPEWKYTSQHTDAFYQFVLDFRGTDKIITSFGFTRVYHRLHDGMKGIKEETPLSKIFCKYLNNSQNLLVKFVRAVLNILGAPIAGHIQLTVYKKY